MKQIEIRLNCLPDRRLGQNASRRQHWGTTTALKNEARSTTVGACLEAKQRWEQEHGKQWKPIAGPATIMIAIYYNGITRPMDPGNVFSALKWHIDSLQTPKTISYCRHKGERPILKTVGGGNIIENDKDLNFSGVEWIKICQDMLAGMVFWIKEG